MSRDGLLLVDKEPGCTSHDVVQAARRLLGQKKTGHCGTLDPAATGLLVLTCGRATRLTRFLINAPKVYAGTVRFGTATDTYDAAGEVIAEGDPSGLDHDTVAAAMERKVGTYQQAAPPFSAKKVKGVKYYELARRGEEVPEALKEVTLFELRPTGRLEDGALEFRLGCTSGTYVRSVAHELGQELGCPAHLAALRRLQVGPFEVDRAATLSELEQRLADAGDPGDAWVAFDDIPLPFAGVTTDAREERRISNGQTVLVRERELEEGDWVKLVNRRRQLIAVGSVVERLGDGVGVVRPKIVFR